MGRPPAPGHSLARPGAVDALMTNTPLTKSRYLAGLQCSKRLWMSIHQRELASPIDSGQQAIINQGTEVGRAARGLFPGGTLVDETTANFSAALARTQSLIADPSIPALFEAAFEHGGVRIRVDILERLGPGRFGMREVKSSTSVKDQHLRDMAVQLWVLRGCGLTVSSVALVHVDNHYVLDTPEIEWTGFFKSADRTREVEALLEAIPGEVRAMHALLEQASVPVVEPGSQCKTPYQCEFWKHCTVDKTPEWFVARQRARAELRAHRFEAAQSGEPWVSGALAVTLAPAQPPVWYLDFEALVSAMPVFPGTHPFEALPFQWSLHRLGAQGEVEHWEFLAQGDVDPSVEVSESLLAELSRDDAPVVVYSSFEARMLATMALRNPARKHELDALRARLFDLLPVVRSSVYFPELCGSFSIKSVGPTLAPHVRYDDLGAVAEGIAAAAAFVRIANGALSETEEAGLREALLAYCKRDTLALMEVHQALRRLVGLG